MEHRDFSSVQPAAGTEAGQNRPPKRRPRTSPIVWGALYLIFAAWITQRTFFPHTLTAELWLTFAAIGLGVLLLGIGVVVALRTRTENRP